MPISCQPWAHAELTTFSGARGPTYKIKKSLKHQVNILFIDTYWNIWNICETLQSLIFSDFVSCRCRRYTRFQRLFGVEGDLDEDVGVWMPNMPRSLPSKPRLFWFGRLQEQWPTFTSSTSWWFLKNRRVQPARRILNLAVATARRRTPNTVCAKFTYLISLYYSIQPRPIQIYRRYRPDPSSYFSKLHLIYFPYSLSCPLVFLSLSLYLMFSHFIY